MRLEELERVFALENSYWWFVGTRNLVYSVLGRSKWFRPETRLLDVGCGSGIMLDKFSSLQIKVGMDLVPEAASFCLGKGHRLVGCARAEELPFRDGAFDLIVCTDVVEHCDDDFRVVTEFNRILQTGGGLLLTVPAFSFLWSKHDEALGHRRRYRKRGLMDLVERSNFKILRATYFNMYLFLPLVVVRSIQNALRSNRDAPHADYPPLPGFFNRALIELSRLESQMISLTTLPLGTSILVLAEKA